MDKLITNADMEDMVSESRIVSTNGSSAETGLRSEVRDPETTVSSRFSFFPPQVKAQNDDEAESIDLIFTKRRE